MIGTLRAAVLVGPTLIFFVALAARSWAYPGDVLATAGALKAPEKQTVTSVPSGEYSVSTETGAAQYSVPLPTPPGRRGMQPALSLVYSSQNPLRGGVAAGWALPVPYVSVDTSDGRLGARSYTSSLIGGQRLVEVDEPAASGVVGTKTYRGEHDASYIRFEHIADGSSAGYWRALTTDGLTYFFGETPESRDQRENLVEMYGDEGRWFVTRTVDRFGNEVRYEYEKVRGSARNGLITAAPVDIALKRVEWTANPRAGLGPHARMDFIYAEEFDLCPGSNVPIGAKFNYRNGIRTYEGARRLVAVDVSVVGEPDGWDRRRLVVLGYDDEAMSCDGLHGPLRLLTSVQEIAYAPDAPPILRPAMTFEYGRIERTLDEEKDIPALRPVQEEAYVGMGKRRFSTDKAGGWPTVESMWADIDGDAVPDVLRNRPDVNSGQSCAFDWSPAGSSALSWHQSKLPALPWAAGARNDGSTPWEREGCSLAAQFSRRASPGIADTCGQPANYTSYRLMDVTGDGRLDLVTAVDYQTGRYDPSSDSTLAAMTAGQPVPVCPLDPPCRDPATGERVPCLFDPVVQLPVTSSPGPSEPDRTGCPFETCRAPSCFPEADCPCSEMYCGAIDLYANVHDYLRDPPVESTEPGGAYWRFKGSPWYQSYSLDSSSNGARGNPACRRLPEMACGGSTYVWRVFDNLGDGTFASSPRLVHSPIPLESDRMSASVGSTDLANASAWHAIVDIDGDGYNDAVWQFPENSIYGYGDTGHFLVFRGDRHGNFRGQPNGEPYYWPTPPVSAGRRKVHHQAVEIKGPARETEGVYHRTTETRVTLADINGDGLPDLVDTRTDEPGYRVLQVYYNTGAGFEDYSAEGTVLAEAYEVATLAANVQVSFNLDPDTLHTRSGFSIATTRLVDLDGDGLADVAKIPRPKTGQLNPWVLPGDDVATPGATALVNTGDRLVPVGGHPALERMRYALSNIQLSYEDLWYVKTDFFDFDGDGLAEAYNADVNASGESSLTVCNPDSDKRFSVFCGLSTTVLADGGTSRGEAMHLLRRIHNGYGATVEYDYAPSTAVAPADGQGSRAPHPIWLVTSMRVHLGETATGDPAPVESSFYDYEGPVFVPDRHDRYGFRGFRKVTVTGPANKAGRRPVTVSEYDYDLDHTGRLAKQVSRDHDGNLQSVGRYGWQPFELFDGRVVAFHQTESASWTCPAGARTEQACFDHDAVKRSTTEWRSLAVSPTSSSQTLRGSWEQSGVPVVWAEYAVVTADHDGGARPGDRRLRSDLEVWYGRDNYQVLPAEMTREVALASDWSATETLSRESIHYDTLGYGFPIETKAWLDSDTIAVTRRKFDDETGQETHLFRPRQIASGAGKPIVTTYDRHELFARTVTNELGHQVTTYRDIATGKVTRTEGVQQGGGRAVVETDYDALGRAVEIRKTVTEGRNGQAALVPVARTFYDDDARPRVVRNEAAIDGTRWTRAETTLDAIGRVLTSTIRTPEGDATTTYAYDSAGNIVEVTSPSPENDSELITYSYEYDEFARLTRVVPPLGASVTYSFDGLVTRVQIGQPGEIGPEDTPARTLERELDVFGRLVRSTESADAGLVDTFYEYDANGNVERIVDPDGIETRMLHDWAGRRRETIRGERRWRYFYDEHGNLIANVAPFDGPSAVAPLYTTSWVYDDLDRVVSKQVPAAGLSPAEIDRFRVGETTYEYDDAQSGANGIGRLARVRLPFATIDYQYTVEGLVSAESRSFEVPLAGNHRLSRSVTRSWVYNRAGQVTESWGGDPRQFGLGRLVTTYDSAGRPQMLEAAWTINTIFGPFEVDRLIADLSRNLAGVPTARSVEGGGFEHQWFYDRLGRVTTHHAKTGGCVNSVCTIQHVAGESLLYDALGNVRESTNLGSGVTFQYTYDGQHQLEGATTVSDPTLYAATFDYTPGGRLIEAYVGSSDESTNVAPRDVEYRYEPPAGERPVDPESVWELTDRQTGQPYATFSYDPRGNRVSRVLGSERMDVRYDGDNKMREARIAGGTERYYYDHAGQRMLTVVSGSGEDLVRFSFGESEYEYSWDGRLTDATMFATIDGMLAGRVKNPFRIDFVISGVLASTLATVGGNASVLAHFTYGPFGEILQAEGPRVDEVRRRFNGKELDELTRLAYYGARYYDRLSLTWTQPDPLYSIAPDIALTEPRRMNRYSFSLNNPVRFLDPTGLDTRDKKAREEFCGCTIVGPGYQDPKGKAAEDWKPNEKYYISHKVIKDGQETVYHWYVGLKSDTYESGESAEQSAAERAATGALGGVDLSDLSHLGDFSDVRVAKESGGHDMGEEGGSGNEFWKSAVGENGLLEAEHGTVAAVKGASLLGMVFSGAAGPLVGKLWGKVSGAVRKATGRGPSVVSEIHKPGVPSQTRSSGAQHSLIDGGKTLVVSENHLKDLKKIFGTYNGRRNIFSMRFWKHVLPHRHVYRLPSAPASLHANWRKTFTKAGASKQTVWPWQ